MMNEKESGAGRSDRSEPQRGPACALCIALLLTMVLLCGGSVPAASAAEEPVVRQTLQNGLQVVIVQNGLAPVVTVQVNYLAGSNEAPEGFPGMAHAQEHMMFRGSPGLSQAQLANLIADLGGNADANTQETITQYFFSVPSDYLDIALHIEAVRMQGVLDAEELWQSERGAIEQEVAQDLSDPFYLFYERLMADMFAGTPYSKTPLGSQASFQNTTGAMLKEFYDKWYAPNNAILVIVGDVEPEKCMQIVKELFGPIAPRKLGQRPRFQLRPLKSSRIELKTDSPFGVAVVAFRLPGYSDPDYSAGRLLADILASQRGSLYALVPEGKALMYDFQTVIFPGTGLGMSIAGFPAGGNAEPLVAEMKKRIAAYLSQGFPADLVEAAKLSAVTSLELAKNSISGLASEWSRALAQQGLSSPDQGIQRMKEVSVEQVNRVARAYLVNDGAVTGILTPQQAGQPTALKGPRGKESFAPQQAQSVALPEWAKKAAELPSQPHSSIKPSDSVLENGLRLIVQQESVSPTVCLYGKVKHQADLETPPGQEGVADLLDDLFAYGTASMDRLAFQKALDDIGVNASVGLSFSLQALDQHFERGVELLAQVLLHPALPEEAFQTLRQQTLSEIEGRLRSPDFLMRQTLKSSLFPKGDPTLRHPTPKSLSSLKRADVQQYYRRVFRPDLTTIVVIGAITPAKARQLVEKHFGAWKATGPKPDTDLPSVPLNQPSATAVPNPSRIQDMVVLAQTLEVTRSDPTYYPLQVGNHVLSGGFYATRLYHDLRQQQGLVYMVESVLQAEKTRGLFEVVYACEPSNVGKARAIVERNLKEMQNWPVSPQELGQAKIILLRSIPLSEAGTVEIAGKLLNYATLGLPLNEAALAGQRYLEISADQVRAAFAKHIRPSDLVQVSSGPPPQ